MADFSWLESLADNEWEQRANGWCLKAMRWSDLIARSRATEGGLELIGHFRAWAEKHRGEHFALTWDVPITATSLVYVCKLTEKSRKSA